MFEDDEQCQTLPDAARRCQTLQLQLAVTLDAGNPFVTGTYSLEGGGEAIGIAYRTLQEISIAAAVQNYPKTIAIGQEIAGGNQMEADGLVCIAKTCVAPAVRYFRERLNKNGTEMYDVVSLFKAVRIVCPMQAHDLHLIAQDVEDLRVVSILHDDTLVAKLLEELPAYLVAAADAVIDTHTTRLQWRRRRTRLPSWQSAA